MITQIGGSVARKLKGEMQTAFTDENIDYTVGLQVVDPFQGYVYENEEYFPEPQAVPFETQFFPDELAAGKWKKQKKWATKRDVKDVTDSVNNLHTKREVIEWRAGLKVTDPLQLYTHEGVEYLPDSEVVPFETKNTFDQKDFILTAKFKSLRDEGDVRGWGAKGDYYLFNGSVNPNATDNSDAIQAAIDEYSGGKLILPQSVGLTGYKTTKPLYLRTYRSGLSAPNNNVEIVKTERTKGAGGADTSYGHITYEVDSVLIIEPAFGGTTLGGSLEKIRFKHDNGQGDYCIYAPIISNWIFNQIEMARAKINFWSRDAWLNTFIQVWARNDGVGVETADYGFKFEAGTSVNMQSCWATNVKIGYDLGQCWYSQINAACDRFTQTAYMGGQNTVWSGCGFESNILESNASVFKFGARNATIVGGVGLGGQLAAVAGATNLKLFECDGTTLNLTGVKFPGITVGGDKATADNWSIYKVSNYSNVTTTSTTLPTSSGYGKLVDFADATSTVEIKSAGWSTLYRGDAPPFTTNYTRSKFGCSNVQDYTIDGRNLSNPAEPLGSFENGYSYKNSYSLWSGFTQVLQFLKPVSGKSNFTVFIKAYMTTDADAALIEAKISAINGVWGSLVILNENGATFTHGLSADTALDGALKLKVGDGVICNAELTIFCKVISGTPRFVWTTQDPS